ncbi:MAG: host specificity factor TipJ family phage tail protein, partial [Alphaproteobacteria bacterium]
MPRNNWARVRPKPGVLIEVIAGVGNPGGGGGEGEKSPMRTLLTIAIVAAAAYAGPLLAAQLGFTGLGATIAGGVISFGITYLGNQLINAIAPPSKPKLPEVSRGGVTAGRDSPTYDISGARNSARPFETVARVFGEHRTVPALAALPWTEIVGDDEYLRLLVCWGIGPLDIASRRIGETSLDAFDDVEREFRRGYQAAQLSDQGAWDPAGGFPADPVFGQWWTASDDGTVDGLAIAAGDTIVFNGLAAATEAEAWDLDGNQPLTLFSDDVFQEDLAVELTAAGGAETRTSQAAADELSIDVTFPQGLVTFDNAGNKGSRTVQVRVEYSVKDADTWIEATVLTVTAARSSAVRAGHRWTVASGQYDVRLTRLTADTESSQIFDACSWTALRSIASVYPIAAEAGLCVEALRIKATGQLRAVIDQYNGIARAILPDWDDGAEAWVTRVTRSPAAAFRAVLQDAGQGRPVADGRIDLDALADWHGKNADGSLYFDAVIDFAISARELLRDIASAGRASPTRIDGKWSVVIDEPRPAPVQHFSPRNSWGFRASKVFADLPHGLRMRFPNRALDWRQDERIVYRDGYGPGNATLFEQLEQFGVTEASQIWVRGREHFATAILRPERYSLQTDVAWVVCTRGDMIRVGHDVLLVGLASGRLKAVADNGTHATGATIDELLVMEEGGSYALRIQHVADDGEVQSQLVPIDTETGGVHEVTFTTPIALADAPEADDLVLFGEAGLETIDGIVTAIRPRADLSAEISFVPAAPEIAEAATASRDFAAGDVDTTGNTVAIAAHPFYDGDTVQLVSTGGLPAPLVAATDYFVRDRAAGTFKLAATAGGAAIDLTTAGSGDHTISRRIPTFTSNLTPVAALGVPVVISARSGGTVLYLEPDGSWTSRILVTVKRPGGLQASVAALRARFRPAAGAGPWETVEAARDAGEISLMPVEDRVAYEYQLCWVRADGTASAWTAAATHTVVGKSAPPSNVSGYSVQQNGALSTHRWDQVPDLDRDGYELRYMAAPFVWDNANVLTSVTRGTLITNAALPPGDWVCGIKAVDTSGNYSAT